MDKDSSDSRSLGWSPSTTPRAADSHRRKSALCWGRMLMDSFYSPGFGLMIALVVVAVIGLMIARKSLKAAEEQAKSARASADDAIAVLRNAEKADVRLVSAAMDIEPVVPSSQLELSFKNMGRSRANDVELAVDLIVPAASPASVTVGPVTIGPGGAQSVAFPRLIEFLSEDACRDVAKGTIPLRFQGTVTYVDVFGVTHSHHPSGTFDAENGQFQFNRDEADS